MENIKPIELVDWIDSNSRSGWLDSTEGKVVVIKCRTVGFLIDETEEGVCLSQSVCRTDGYKPFADIINIPKCCIQHRQTVIL